MVRLTNLLLFLSDYHRKKQNILNATCCDWLTLSLNFLAPEICYRQPVTRLYLVLLWLVCGSSALAGEALRPDFGAHQSSVNHLSVWRNTVLSTSDDGSARLWEDEGGTLVKTYRVPAGAGNEGQLYSGALSPDLQWVAVSGWTGVAAEGSPSLFVYSRQRGALHRRLPRLPGIPQQVLFSPDGKWLVAILGGDQGVRAWRTSDWKLIATDADYHGRGMGGCFMPDGRLYVIGEDRLMRVYAAESLQRLSTTPLPTSRASPLRLACAPDGRRLALGYHDTPRVDVFAIDSGHVRHTQTLEPGSNGGLGVVSWSADGQTLYAGGAFNRRGKVQLLRWRGERLSGPDYWPVFDNTMTALAATATGVAVGSASGHVCLLKAEDQVVCSIADLADFRHTQGKIGVSANGDRIQFRWGKERNQLAQFSVSQRAMSFYAPQDESLFSHGAQKNTLKLAGEDKPQGLTVNGAPITLERGETVRASATQLEHALIGTEWGAHLVDSHGRKIWSVATSAPVWAVAFSGDGRLVVLAQGNGLIRWLRVQDGKEILSLLAVPEKKHWVAWTAGGYYMASPGGDELIGWQVDGALDAPVDFYSASKFKSRFYKPEIVESILSTLDEQQSIRQAGVQKPQSSSKSPTPLISQERPPVIHLANTEDLLPVESGKASIMYTLSEGASPTTRVNVLVNGRPWKSYPHGLNIKRKIGSTQSLLVEMPAGATTVSIIAENRFGSSAPVSARLQWKDIIPAPDKPRLLVVAVGVSHYVNPALKLDFAAKDALDVAQVFQRQQGRLYPEVRVKTLSDQQASKPNILAALSWLGKESRHIDTAVVFMAGHGIADDKANFYFAPTEFEHTKPALAGIAQKEIQDALTAIPGKVVLFIDSCHAGQSFGVLTPSKVHNGAGDINRLSGEFSSADVGIVVFAASTGKQSSIESQDWGNGAFTKALLEGLNGKADLLGKDRTITINELDAWLADRVAQLTNGEQTPTTAKPQTIPNFPLVKR